MILFLHRKQLRTKDVRAFAHIASRQRPSIHAVILDPQLLADGRAHAHSGQAFLGAVAQLQRQYEVEGATLHIWNGAVVEVVEAVCAVCPVEEIVYAADDTPYAQQRDAQLQSFAKSRGIVVTTCIEDVLVLPERLHQTANRSLNDPFKVFTPFFRRWQEALRMDPQPPIIVGVRSLSTVAHVPGMERWQPREIPWPAIQEQDATESILLRLRSFAIHRLSSYATQRDVYSGDPSTSQLSKSLNTGSVSVRQAYETVVTAGAGSNVLAGEELPTHVLAWVRQLAWRDFYAYQARMDKRYFHYDELLDHPDVTKQHYRAWVEGRTGIPIIDAAMTQLRITGWLHNRLRMVVAMFLTKNLLCPFHYGEAYFRHVLADYDNIQNRGGWLWCSSIGYDAAPYFRIMNPVLQSEKWDPEGAYIRAWLPEQANESPRTIHLPRVDAIVDVSISRKRAIDVYRQLLQEMSSTPSASPGVRPSKKR